MDTTLVTSNHINKENVPPTCVYNIDKCKKRSKQMYERVPLTEVTNLFNISATTFFTHACQG